MQKHDQLPTEQTQSSKNIASIAISVVLTAVLVGGGIYLWSQSNFDKKELDLQYLIADSNRYINELEKEISQMKTSEQSMSTTPETSIDIDFPVVVYARPGLLNNTEEGKEEKKKLEEKLINPYADYYNEDEIRLIAMYITVPENLGEEYEVVAIFASEKQSGTSEFIFGAREQTYDYWKPECMGPCDFSEAFRMKYPQIVE